MWADKNLITGIVSSAAAATGGDCGANTPAHGSQVFVADTVWCPPSTATYPLAVKAVVVGGGGGFFNNATVNYYGGGSGYVAARSFNIAAAQPIQIKVGKGGRGGFYTTGASTVLIPAESGGQSSFGGYVYARGGSATTQNTFPHGGSGGSRAIAGGDCSSSQCGGGSNGNVGYDYTGAIVSRGQGTFVNSATTIRNTDGSTVAFAQATFAAGSGGFEGLGGSMQSYCGGGGGLVINGINPKIATYDAGGFGAGGTYSGIGGYPATPNGVDGVVYVEW